jgi:hypothetical protein
MEKLPDPQTFGDFFNTEVKVFAYINMANNLNLMAKKAASNKCQQALDAVLKSQPSDNHNKGLNTRMFRVLMNMALAKYEEAAK